MQLDLWVVVAFFNEEELIKDTLNGLCRQTDKNFSIILVDNNSTDGSREIIDEFSKNNPDMSIKVIEETQQGTGAAVDTGFRYAIEHGATHIARTDADSIPTPEWISALKHHFEQGALIIGGRIKPRSDEPFFSRWDSIFIPSFYRFSEKIMRFVYREKGNNYPMFLVPGLNMAIESNLYILVEGFPRSSIRDTDEDNVLHAKVCKTIEKHQAHFARDVIVYGSTRRVNEYGYIKTILWYWGRKVKPDLVDIR